MTQTRSLPSTCTSSRPPLGPAASPRVRRDPQRVPRAAALPLPLRPRPHLPARCRGQRAEAPRGRHGLRVTQPGGPRHRRQEQPGVDPTTRSAVALRRALQPRRPITCSGQPCPTGGATALAPQPRDRRQEGSHRDRRKGQSGASGLGTDSAGA